MKLYEKIVVGAFTLFFALLFVNYNYKIGWFGLTSWLLAVSYIIGGYWFFNQEEKEFKERYLPISSGIIFGITLLCLPFSITMHPGILFKLIPIPNMVFWIGLGYYLFKNKNSNKYLKIKKSLFLRSTIILVLTLIFVYIPISLKPYRALMKIIRSDNVEIVNNIKMFDYKYAFDKAYQEGNCDEAIEFAEKGVESGRKWLDLTAAKGWSVQPTSALIDSLLKSTSDLPDSIRRKVDISIVNAPLLWKMNGTFENLFKAYRCKAENLFSSEKFSESLIYYRKANIAINSCDQDKSWDEHKAWMLCNIANCYRHLSQYERADSLYIQSIDLYKQVKDTADCGLAKIMTGLAISFSEQEMYSYSNEMFRIINPIIIKDSACTGQLALNYMNIAKNYTYQDSFPMATQYFEKAFPLLEKGSIEYWHCKLLLAACYYKQDDFVQAGNTSKEAIEGFSKVLGPDHQYVAECHYLLGMVNTALAKYNEAREYFDKGFKITSKNYGETSSNCAKFLKAMAMLNREMGNYKESKQQYDKCIDIYKIIAGNSSSSMTDVLSGLADLEIILSEYIDAKVHSDSSMSITSRYTDLTSPRTTVLLNNAGYVNYCINYMKEADTLYRKSIKINNSYGMSGSMSMAVALNGLGLVEMAKKAYSKADSLFVASLEINKNKIGENHPSTAIVLMNLGILRTYQNKLDEAEELLNKAIQIDNNFLPKDHNALADIYVALGDLYTKKKLVADAKEKYTHALSIYLRKFNEEHLKVKQTKAKLKV